MLGLRIVLDPEAGANQFRGIVQCRAFEEVERDEVDHDGDAMHVEWLKDTVLISLRSKGWGRTVMVQDRMSLV